MKVSQIFCLTAYLLSSILDPRSSILDPRSSILDPQPSILGPSIRNAFHDRQQFDQFERFSDVNLEPGDQSADAVFGAGIGRERYGWDVPAAIRIHLPHPAHQLVAVNARHLDV